MSTTPTPLREAVARAIKDHDDRRFRLKPSWDALTDGGKDVWRRFADAALAAIAAEGYLIIPREALNIETAESHAAMLSAAPQQLESATGVGT